ncbi:MAG TPA: hypothetical protein VIG25_04855 [Pyrinomonadaceae bacterium]|jgi:hypothetical protein
MRFHNVFPSDVGGYAEPEFGYYGEPMENYGYFAEDPYMSQYSPYGEVDPAYGYYGQVDPAFGYYGEVDPLGYYGEVDPLGYYGYSTLGAWGEPDAYGEVEPVGYFAEDFPVGYYGEELPLAGYAEDPMGYYGEDPYQHIGYYGQTPEMVGYGETEYGEPEFGSYGGYVRDVPPAFNAGCPLPTNLSGFDDVDGYAGYATPATVNPTCDQMTSQPGSSPSPPETFKPLW